MPDDTAIAAGKPRHAHTDEEDHAARVIQRAYRGHQARTRVNRMKMQSEARWDDLIKQSGERTYAAQQLENKNDVSSRWSRAMHAASRLQTGDGLYTNPNPRFEGYEDEHSRASDLSSKERRKRKARLWGSLSMGVGKMRDETEVLPYTSKALEQQHWLEMIDGKHRYGSNMKFYFRKWKESDTEDNFFRWLDRGEGKDLDLEEMPRERLEKERIQYLSAEQRLNYLVKFDPEGLLRWVHNNELVDTAAGRWKDLGDGGGIVPTDSDDEEDQGDGRSDSSSILSDTYSAISSDLQEDGYSQPEEPDKGDEGWLQKKANGITPNGITKDLMRKTTRRNTWIYSCDLKLNMFVGMKRRGNFQHSSFLAGGKVTSAGLIVVKQGVIKSLNPHSGHYRSSIEHYRAFVAQLEDKGADLSHVKIAKSVMTLWGLSKYAAVTNGQKDLASRFKSALGMPHKPTEAEQSAELQKNAEREEREHQARIKAVHAAEREQTSEEEKEKARKEVLFGKKERVSQS